MNFDEVRIETVNRTKQTIEILKQDFSGLRTGRASIGLLDGIRVNVYGSDMPLNQLSTVSVHDNSTLMVTVWDINNVAMIEKTIRDSGLGLNPMTAGGVIRLNLPPLTEERRKELSKVIGKYGEEAKISIRNIRQDVMNKIKRSVNDKLISEDESKRYENDIQKIIDEKIQEIESLTKQKETDIMKI